MKSTHVGPYLDLLRRLTQARKEAGVSQADLADLLSKPQSFVSKVESGERRLDLVEYVWWTKALRVEPALFLQELSDAIGYVLPSGRRLRARLPKRKDPT